ncbi:hypothetical protein Q8G43_03860 [Acinetobacter schindleri]|uniref:hypothetical protein n=1 Tax=Acinetobacter schindleri TaxID=108981 RepID=UPI00273159E2|nr:hypothetical protein [Acinetobacter schindleri]MDP1444100.1 hypothetical protein [Acinetobacter schindleri]
MNDVKKDQSVDQGDDDSNDILGGISFDEKDQMIESVAEAILNRILDDERIKALKPPKDTVTASRRYGDRRKIEKNTNESVLLEDLIPVNNKALAASIKQHKWAKEYLSIIETLYEELRVEHWNFPFGRNSLCWQENPLESHVLSFLFNLDVLKRIEVFMLALLYQPTPAFIFYGTSGDRVKEETQSQLKERMTRLGLEFLFLWDKKDLIKSLGSEYLTRNVQVLVDFFNELEPAVGEKTSFTLKLDLNLDSLFDLNHLLIKLKSFVDSGRHKKNLPSKMQYRLRDGDEEPATVILKPSHVDMTDSWKKRSKQLSEAVSYFKKYEHESILLYRTQIRLNSKVERVTAEQFKDFFGVFNKKAKKPNGLNGYSDFLYFWKEDSETQDLILDLVCVFKAETLIQQIVSDDKQLYKSRNICTELENYFQNVLTDKPEIFEGKNVCLEFEPIPVLQNQSYGFAPEFLIEAGDKTKWKIFEQKILPYFIFLEFFDIDYSDEIRKRFMRGQTVQ